jgi:hypothetical protein
MPGTKYESEQGYSATGGLKPVTNPNEQLFLFFGVVHMQQDGPEGHCMCGFNTFSLAARDEMHAREQILAHPYYRQDMAGGWKKPEIYVYRASHTALSLSVLKMMGKRIEEARREGYNDGMAAGKRLGYTEGFREAVVKVGSHHRGITLVELD